MNEIVSLLTSQCPDLDLADTETAVVQVGPSGSKTEATIVYRPNRTEFERRRAVSLGGVTRLDWLDLMMDLPAGLPVLRKDTDWRIIRKLPRGCVDITPEGIVRQLVKPLDVRLAIVPEQQWKSGLTRAGRFGAYCTRVLALSGEPRNLVEKTVEADFWGIGVIVGAVTEPELVVAPTPFVQHRHTPAAWAFAEDIYRQVVAQSTKSPGVGT